MEVDVAQHLANTYGDKAFAVAKMCKSDRFDFIYLFNSILM